MAVMQMQKMSICALKKERKQIMEYLQRKGVMQITEWETGGNLDIEEGFERMDTATAISLFERNTALAENALAVLSEYAPVNAGMFDSLQGRRRISEEEFQSVIGRREEIMAMAVKIIGLQKQAAAKESDITKLQNQIEGLTPWLSLDMPMEFSGTEHVTFLYGSFPGFMTQTELYRRMEDSAEYPESADVRIISSDKNQTCVMGICLRAEEAEFESALRAMGFSKPTVLIRSIPTVTREKWNRRMETFEKERTEIQEKIKELASYRKDLEAAADYFRSRTEKYRMLPPLLQTKHTFFLTGYLAKKDVPMIQKELMERFTAVVEIAEIPEEEEMPVKLSNSKFAAPVEGIVASYGLPSRGEIDPSGIMAFFYYAFFGMMLSDAAYGLLIVAVCTFLLLRFKNMEESLNKSIHMFLYCGISTTIWGFLFGGFFGDLIDVISANYFGKTVTLQALWFVPLHEPMRLLVYSLLFGLIHMLIGLGIKAYLYLKDGKVKDCICDAGFWFCFLTGLILMLLPTGLFQSVSQMVIVFPEWMNVLAKVLAILGAVGLLLMAGRRKKNPALRLALGAYELYNVTSWLSDLLSYSRLLALGLATGVIATVVNSMAGMFGTGIGGTILFILIFIVGHTLNMGINLLGAYVHTNRLQYVEFFGKFYEGGGTPFAPFQLKTNYIQLKK